MSMEQTQTHKTTLETKRLPDSSWDQISNYVSLFTSEPGFLSFVEQNGIKENTIDYAYALSQYAEAEINQQEELVDDHTATQIRILANAPYITHASLRINELAKRRVDGHRLPENEWQELNSLKEQAVEYNQMLSKYMYTYNDESFSEISQNIGDLVLDHFPVSTNEAARTVEGVVHGARTEAATRHLFDKIEVPYRTATKEEDLRGTDLILTKQDKEYHVDIKRSLDQLAANDGGYEGKMFSIYENKRGQKKILLFPGFNDNDLADNLHLNEKTIENRGDQIAAQLMLAVREIDG